jgi:hypothetical protein
VGRLDAGGGGGANGEVSPGNGCGNGSPPPFDGEFEGGGANVSQPPSSGSSNKAQETGAPQTKRNARTLHALDNIGPRLPLFGYGCKLLKANAQKQPANTRNHQLRTASIPGA